MRALKRSTFIRSLFLIAFCCLKARAAGLEPAKIQFIHVANPEQRLSHVAELAAAEKFYQAQKPARFAVIYGESGQVHAEFFGFAPDGWQEKLGSKIFSTTESAELWLRSLGFLERQDSGVPRFAGGLRTEALTPRVPNLPLWEIKNAWSTEWETRYAAWVHQEVDENFFVKHQISTDCSDVAYVLRWIFARINHLPAANRLMGSNQKFSTLDTRTDWMRLPTSPDWDKDQRLRAALDYLLENTYTHTLIKDSYPVAVNTSAFSAGTYHLALHASSGHTQFIFKSKENGYGLPFMMISSTVPRAIRTLMVHFFWGEQPASREQAGFMRMDWAVKNGSSISLMSEAAHPWYSLDQYSKNFFGPGETGDFPLRLIQKLDPAFNGALVAERILSDIKAQIVERIHVVQEGYAICSHELCTPRSVNYDNWSTPDRDARLLAQLRLLPTIFGFCADCAPMIRDFVSEKVDVGGHQTTLQALAYTFVTGNFYSDPRVSPMLRWGLDEEWYVKEAVSSWKGWLESRVKSVLAGKDSYDDDLQIKRSLARIAQYHRYTGLGNDQTALEILSHLSVSVTGIPQKTYADVFRDFIFWSSAAEATFADRWQSEASSPFPKIGRQAVVITAQGWLWSEQSGVLKDLRAKQPIEVPAGFERWMFVANDGARAVVKRESNEGAVLATLDAHAGLVKQWNIPEVVFAAGPLTSASFFSNYLVLVQGFEHTLLSIEGDTLKVVDRFTASAQATLGPAVSVQLGVDAAGVFRFLDRSNLHKGFQKIALPGFTSVYQIFENDDWAVFLLLEEGARSFRWDKHSGVLSPYFSNIQQMTRNLDWLAQKVQSAEQSSLEVMRLGANLEPLNKMEYEGATGFIFEQQGVLWVSSGQDSLASRQMQTLKADNQGKIVASEPLAKTTFSGAIGAEYFSLLRLGEGPSPLVISSLWSYGQTGLPRLVAELPAKTQYISLLGADDSLWSSQWSYITQEGALAYRIQHGCVLPRTSPAPSLTDVKSIINDDYELKQMRIFGLDPAGEYLEPDSLEVFSGSLVKKGESYLWLAPELCH